MQKVDRFSFFVTRMTFGVMVAVYDRVTVNESCKVTNSEVHKGNGGKRNVIRVI